MLKHSNYQLELFWNENFIKKIEYILVSWENKSKRQHKWGQSCVCMWRWFKVKVSFLLKRLFESKNNCAFWEKNARWINLFWFFSFREREFLRKKAQCWWVFVKIQSVSGNIVNVAYSIDQNKSKYQAFCLFFFFLLGRIYALNNNRFVILQIKIVYDVEAFVMCGVAKNRWSEKSMSKKCWKRNVYVCFVNTPKQNKMLNSTKFISMEKDVWKEGKQETKWKTSIKWLFISSEWKIIEMI